jgi:transposase
LIVDGASIYKSKSTLAWLKERPRIVLVPLPSYAPKLNLQEQVWRWLRAVVTHNITSALWMRRSLPQNAFSLSWASSLKPCCG